MAKSSRKAEPGTDSALALNVTTTSETAKGMYTNLAVVRHTRLEFVIDFLFALDNDAQLVSRIVLSPDHAQRLAKTLKDNLDKHASTDWPAPKG